jgi:hypothetical protein
VLAHCLASAGINIKREGMPAKQEATEQNVAVSISDYVNELFIFVDQDKLKDTLISFQGNNNRTLYIPY